MYSETLEQLKRPFHPSHISWKPGMISKDQGKALALAYADPRAYQNRLDEVCGMGWAVTYTPWGDRIVCHLTIEGVTRSSSGEPDTASERSEIAGTSAEAQAFKRACAMFGLGATSTLCPRFGLSMTRQPGNLQTKPKPSLPALSLPIIAGRRARRMRAKAPAKALSRAAMAQAMPAAGLNLRPGQAPEPAPKSGADAASAALRSMFNEAGLELYGETWEQICRHNTERITGGKSNDPSILSDDQIQKLITGMRKIQGRRFKGASKAALAARPQAR
jgi:hypothetical protein